MLNNPENMNTQNGSLPLIAAVNFKAEVLESKQPVLVEFWAPWSRPCQVMDSVLQELASAWAGKVKVVKVNADDSLDLSLWYDIQSVPTLLYFVQRKSLLAHRRHREQGGHSGQTPTLFPVSPMHPLLIITVVVLSVLYALAWHDQPARNDRPIYEPYRKPKRTRPSHGNTKQDYELSR